MYDVYCFGLVLLEMISSDVNVSHAFKYLCKSINHGNKNLLISMVDDAELRDILNKSLDETPSKRWTVKQLQNHNFFQKSDADHHSIFL